MCILIYDAPNHAPNVLMSFGSIWRVHYSLLEIISRNGIPQAFKVVPSLIGNKWIAEHLTVSYNCAH